MSDQKTICWMHEQSMFLWRKGKESLQLHNLLVIIQIYSQQFLQLKLGKNDFTKRLLPFDRKLDYLNQIIMRRWLFQAVKYGEKKQNACKLIAEGFAGIHELVDGVGCSLLHISANHRNLEVAQFIFNLYEEKSKQDPDKYNNEYKKQLVNKKDSKGFTALHYAIFRQQMPMIQLLQRNGADVYLCSGEGLNSLHLAAQGDSPLLMFYFMGKGMKIGSTDFGGSTPLHWACYSGAERAVAALMAWGAEIDCQQNLNGSTPLHLAVTQGNVRIVKWLLVQGCDTTIKNKKGATALTLAIQKDQKYLAEIIQDKFNLLTLLNFKTKYRPTPRRGFPFYLFTISFLLSLTINVFYLAPARKILEDAATIALFTLGGILLTFYFVLNCSNPGKIIPPQQINMVRLMKKSILNSVCFKCSIIKPPRSRHCNICNACISVYDHHCPWIGNCVGNRNYLFFFIFLSLLAVYLVYNIIFHIFKLILILQNHSQLFFGAKIMASIFNLLMGFLYIVPVIYLVILNSKNALKNVTSFQKISGEKTIFKINSKASGIQTQLTQITGQSTNVSKSPQGIEIVRQTQEQYALSNCKKMCWTNASVDLYNQPL